MSVNRTVQCTLLIQLVITSLGALLALALAGWPSAYSAGLGGGINLLATGLFGLRMFATRAGAGPEAMLQALVLAEVTKIATTVLAFVAVFTYLDVVYPPFFITYVVAMLAYWLVLPLSTT